jgi:glycerophosphoryl diester phosphodiesterase
MKIAIGCDEAALDLKEILKAHLMAQREVPVEVVDFGVHSRDPVDYPDIALDVAEAIARNECARGVLLCGTGLGMAIAANKVRGIRAATCHDVYSAERAQKSNDAQVITLGARVVGPELAKMVISAWLASSFDGGKSTCKVDKISRIEEAYRNKSGAPAHPAVLSLIVSLLFSFIATTSFAAAPAPGEATQPENASVKSAQTSARPNWNVRGHIAPADFLIQAHRGAGELAEENTLEAFELGWKLGCYPESDLRTTKDGVIVTFHDNDFSRVVRGIPEADKKKGVADVTLAELQKLDVGSWKGDQFAGRHVITIGQAFEKMQGRPERHLYMDIKNVDLPQLAAQVKQYNIGPQVIFTTTKYPLIRQWKKLIPDGQTLLWMGGTEEALEKRLEELRKTNFADITQLQIHAHMKDENAIVDQNSIDPFKESDAFLIRAGNEIRSHGILFQSLPYGGSTAPIYWKLLDLGVMSFATDHPLVVREAIENYHVKDSDSDSPASPASPR